MRQDTVKILLKKNPIKIHKFQSKKIKFRKVGEEKIWDKKYRKVGIRVLQVIKIAIGTIKSHMIHKRLMQVIRGKHLQMIIKMKMS